VPDRLQLPAGLDEAAAVALELRSEASRRALG